MNNRFTIGQMASLHNTPIKTLRYYDEIGLFKPAEIGDNGYRYYSTDQFEVLNTIKYLKGLGISLKRIKEFMTVKDLEHFVNQLRRQRDLTNKKIEELTIIKNTIDKRIHQMLEASEVDNIGEVIIKQFDEREIYSLKENFKDNNGLEICLRKLENEMNKTSTIIIGKVGLTVSKENLSIGNYHEYNSIFIIDEDIKSTSSTKDTLKGGSYATIYFRGGHKDSVKYYQILLKYIGDNGYKVIGDSVERTLINEFVSKDKKEYLTEIQIPIKNR